MSYHNNYVYYGYGIPFFAYCIPYRRRSFPLFFYMHNFYLSFFEIFYLSSIDKRNTTPQIIDHPRRNFSPAEKLVPLTS